MVAQAAAVVVLPETSPRAPGALRSLIPQLEMPEQTRRPLLAAAPVLFAVWALGGFYASLGPNLIDHLVGSASVVDGGLGLGVLTGVAALTTYVLRNAPARSVMLIGTSTLTVGVAVTLAAVRLVSPSLFFVGTIVAGIGFGAGFQGGIRLVAPLAHPDQRAGVLSVLYVVSYLGLGIPAIAAGVAVVHGGGLVPTSYAVRPGRHGPGHVGHLQSHSSSPTISHRPRRYPGDHHPPPTTPGPEHPITLEKRRSRVVVHHSPSSSPTPIGLWRCTRPATRPSSTCRWRTSTAASSRPSDQHTYCPYKGDASYYDIVDGDGTDLAAVVWFYDEPFPAVADIKATWRSTPTG